MKPTESEVGNSTMTAKTSEIASGVPLVEDTPSPTAPSGDCAWKWNTESLSALSERLQSALESAGLVDAIGIATAYGEDCIDSETGEVRYFATMQTEFNIKLSVDDLIDLEELGELLARVLGVLVEFPPEDTPGPMAGRVTIFFISMTEQHVMLFKQDAAIRAWEEGLTGETLLETLGGQP